MTSIKRDSNSILLSASHLLLDIEGTTSSISFVKDVLFPYVRNHLEEHLNKNWDTAEVQEVIKNLKAQAKDDEEKKVEGVVIIPDAEDKQDVLQAIVNNINWQMDNDRKTKCLKDLQGLIMEEGYKKGELKGHVYDDVEPCLKSWTKDNKTVYIYSSGSVHAQKLLFGHSEKGDLLPLIKGHFDTTVGMKGDVASYKKILEEISCNATDVAFFTDVPKEARAAKEAGILAVLLSREGNAPLTEADKAEFSTITSFTEIEFETNCKKRKVCSETDVTNENKQVTNCTVSFEEENKPNDPNLKTNNDVEMMEVEESSAIENGTVENKVECSQEVKVEDKQESNNPDHKENSDSSKQGKLEIIEEENSEGEKTETVTEKTDIDPIVENNKEGDEITGENKTKKTNEVADKKESVEELLNSGGSENKKEHNGEPELKVEKDVEDKMDHNGEAALKLEKDICEDNKIEDIVESELKEKKDVCEDETSKRIVDTKEESKQNSEDKIKDSCESELKVEKSVCKDGTFEETSTLKEESKEKCEDKIEDTCESELKVEKDVCEDKTSEKICSLIEKSKENVEKAESTVNVSFENISVETLQEKVKIPEVGDVDNNADKTNIAITEHSTSLLETVEKDSTCVNTQAEIESNEKCMESKVTESCVESKTDNVCEPSSEKTSSEKLSENESFGSQENTISSDLNAEEKTIENNFDNSKIVEKSNESMEVESSLEVKKESQKEKAVEKNSDSCKEIEKSDESMEVESRSELQTEPQNGESQMQELKSRESKKEPKVAADESLAETKLELKQDNINTDCKSDIKNEDSMISEIASEQNQKSCPSGSEIVNGNNLESTSESSLAVMSDKSGNEQTTTGGKQDICVEDNSSRVNGEADELMEIESQIKQPTSEKKESLTEEPKSTEYKFKESDDGSEKQNVETKSNESSANNVSSETLNKKEETKTETEIVPSAGNNGLKAESNGCMEETGEAGSRIGDGQASVNGTGASQVDKLANGNVAESQLNGSSSPDLKQGVSNGNDIAKPVEGKKCDSTENNTQMETVVEA